MRAQRKDRRLIESLYGPFKHECECECVLARASHARNVEGVAASPYLLDDVTSRTPTVRRSALAASSSAANGAANADGSERMSAPARAACARASARRCPCIRSRLYPRARARVHESVSGCLCGMCLPVGASAHLRVAAGLREHAAWVRTELAHNRPAKIDGALEGQHQRQAID